MSLPVAALRPSAMRVLDRLPSRASRSMFTRRTPTFFAPPRLQRIAPIVPPCQQRAYSSANDQNDPRKGQLSHVTEEANETAEIMGEEPIHVEEYGTPVEEIFERENDVENAPEIIKEEIKESHNTNAFSALEESHKQGSSLVSQFPNPTPKVLIPPYPAPQPITPIPAAHSINHRFHPLLRQLTPHFMQHGKLARAQATIQEILQILRTKPAPRPGKHPLIPNAPELSLLPSDPVAYLQTAIDSVAPLFKMKSTRGSGGTTVQIPAPLPVKVRRRKAMEWMIAASDGKKRMKTLPERFAEEVEAVVLGTSSCWEKRIAIHKLAVTNRANVGQLGGKRGRKSF